jgi:RimJ/RimL family protein N-acetyltransferase
MKTLHTERLILRPFQISDETAMYQVFRDAEVMRYSYGVQTKQWVRDWIRFRILENQDDAITSVWVVTEKAHTIVTGYCGLFHIPDLAGSPEMEIGYRLIQKFWGLGYATEAACAIRDYAFDELGITRLVAMIDPANTASIRVAEKLGMRYEKEVVLAGYTHPDHLYVLEK